MTGLSVLSWGRQQGGRPGDYFPRVEKARESSDAAALGFICFSLPGGGSQRPFLASSEGPLRAGTHIHTSTVVTTQPMGHWRTLQHLGKGPLPRESP